MNLTYAKGKSQEPVRDPPGHGEDEYLKALVDTGNVVVIKKVLKSQESDYHRSKIIKLLIPKWWDIINGLINVFGQGSYRSFPDDDESIKELVKTNNVKLIKNVFESREYDDRRSKIIEYLIPQWWDVIDELIKVFEEEVYRCFPDDDESIKALVAKNDVELIRKVFEAQEFDRPRSKIVKHLIPQWGIIEDLVEVSGGKIYQFFPSNKESIEALGNANNFELIARIFKFKSDYRRSEIIKHLMPQWGIIEGLAEVFGDKVYVSFPHDAESIKALGVANKSELIIKIFEHKSDYRRSEIIKHLVVHWDMIAELINAFKEEAYGRLPDSDESIKALIATNDFGLVAKVFEYQKSEYRRSKVIKHLIPQWDKIAELVKAFEEGSYRCFPDDEESIEALVATKNVELIQKALESKDDYSRSEIIEHLMPQYLIEVFEEEACKKYILTSKESIKVFGAGEDES